MGLVETFKEAFSPNELSAIAGMDRFDWHVLPASDHSGEILIGSKKICSISWPLIMVFSG